jgi:hypothetical protein
VIHTDYWSNGVSITPAAPSPLDTVKITYNGLLPRNGATEIYAHISFQQDWNITHDYRMNQTERGFETAIAIPGDATMLNICFKDAADNWDNNSGSNYVYHLQGQAAVVAQSGNGFWAALCDIWK